LSKFKPVKAGKIIKVLDHLGFVSARQKGSHLIMKHVDGRIVVIPIHSDEEIGRGLLQEIIRGQKLRLKNFLSY
jgi:predicted RNA binding protein YcfA (HicA-like mRNA interferase family)